MKKHILVDISAHGFGHFSQTAPIINLLGKNNPDLIITLRTTLPTDFVRTRIHTPLTIIAESLDFGMQMNSAINTDVAASEKAYAELHKDWRGHLTAQKKRLKNLKPDLVFANIPYLSLAAATQLNINTVALCSLNWAHIYQGYFHTTDNHQHIYREMLDAYNNANIYLRPTPSMEMPELKNIKNISSIVKLGKNKRAEINATGKLRDNETLVLLALGGIKTSIPIETWPQIPGIRWLTTWDHAIKRDDIVPHKNFNMRFTDILCSSDVIVTKPGYGVITEAVCNQKPVLYIRRHDWPEENNIVDWLQQHGVAQEISQDTFFNGKILEEIKKLNGLKITNNIKPDGAREAAEIIERFLYEDAS